MQIEKESGTAEEHNLNKEARKWATRVAREHKNVIHSQRVRDMYSDQKLFQDVRECDCVIFVFVDSVRVWRDASARAQHQWIRAEDGGGKREHPKSRGKERVSLDE